MRNSKNTKRAFLASLLSMVMCAAMLIGSTFAWFTDSVTSAGNKIQAGNLNIDLLVKEEGGSYQSVKTSTDPIFSYDKWEPGYTVAKNLKVTTSGNLALKYTMNIVTDGEISKLADVIDVYYAAAEVTVTDRALTGLTKIGTLGEVLGGQPDTVINDTLIPGENAEDFATVALKMREDAGNEYQNLSIGSFDLRIAATQYTYETDSFNNEYDKNAQYPVYVKTESELKDAITNAENGGTIVLNEDVTVSESLTVADKNVQINLNSKELKSTAAVNLIQATGSANVSVSGGSLSVDNASQTAAVIAEDSARVCIENCEISYPQGKGYAVVTNGSTSKDVSVVMRNTTITANKNYACYFPAGNIVMENCNVTGAVIISGGDVTIDGGIYTADGFSGQSKIWHRDDTISYMDKFSKRDGCGHMGDSILIMDRRSSGYGVANVTIQNVTFNTELTLQDGSKATAYAVKYVDYNNISGAERGRLNVTGNTYNHKLAGGQEPLMFIGIDGTAISGQ